jgi:hypothetical protein
MEIPPAGIKYALPERAFQRSTAQDLAGIGDDEVPKRTNPGTANTCDSWLKYCSKQGLGLEAVADVPDGFKWWLFHVAVLLSMFPFVIHLNPAGAIQDGMFFGVGVENGMGKGNKNRPRFRCRSRSNEVSRLLISRYFLVEGAYTIH